MSKRNEGVVLAALKAEMLERGLRPGDPMPTENELVEILDVSRTSVREAVRTLAAQDILEVKHGTGTFVGQFSLRPLVDQLVFRGVLLSGDDIKVIREVVDMRITLDLAMAQQVTTALTPEDNDYLSDLVGVMVERADEGHSFEVEDRAFHEGLANCSGNRLMTEMVGALWEIHSLTMPRLGLPTTNDLAGTARAHRIVLDGAASGDPSVYIAAVHAHYAPLLKVLETYELAQEKGTSTT